jgi:hypothetical protein
MRDAILVFRCEGERFARGRIEKYVVMEKGSWEKEGSGINSVWEDHMFRGGRWHGQRCGMDRTNV